jgi:Holliday junction resolvase RusA-like endonuclease
MGKIIARAKATEDENMSQSDYIELTIPFLPPGSNRTYQPARNRIILTPAARRWDQDAALIVGTAAAWFEFEPDLTASYQIVIRWWGGKHDTDAHLKLIQDCVTRKLGFDDRQISVCVIQRYGPDWRSEPEGVRVYLVKRTERDWIGKLINERLEV